MANPLIEVMKTGQSIWYDNIRRAIRIDLGADASAGLKRLLRLVGEAAPRSDTRGAPRMNARGIL